MSARTKIAKSLQVGAYAPVVFQPGATGEHIKRAVTELGLTGVTICGETVTAEASQALQPTEYIPLEFINVQEAAGGWDIDWVTPYFIQRLGRTLTRRAALAMARPRARRLGLTIHEGPFKWEAEA